MNKDLGFMKLNKIVLSREIIANLFKAFINPKSLFSIRYSLLLGNNLYQKNRGYFALVTADLS